MNKLAIVKTVAGVIVSLGVGAVVGNLVKATTPETINTAGKVLVGIGALALGGYFSVKASEQTETSIQEIVDQIAPLANGEIQIAVVTPEPLTEA